MHYLQLLLPSFTLSEPQLYRTRFKKFGLEAYFVMVLLKSTIVLGLLCQLQLGIKELVFSNREMRDRPVTYPTSLGEMQINLKVITSVKIAVIFSLLLWLLPACLALKSSRNKYSYIPFRVFVLSTGFHQFSSAVAPPNTNKSVAMGANI